jgi:hypothetical protein
MTDHVNASLSDATSAREGTSSHSGAQIRRLVVTSVATVLVAAAVTSTAVYLVADKVPTAGVFRDPAQNAARAAEQQLVNGIDPATDLADILRFGAGAGALAAAEARMDALVDGIDPATDVPEALGLGAVRAQGDSPAVEQLVWGIDPSIDVRAVLGLNVDPGPGFSMPPNVR